MYTTKVIIPDAGIKINHEHHIMTLGSCFSESIGDKLSQSYFLIDKNPFGVLYNPVSISNSIYYLLNKKQFSEEEIFHQNTLWNSFSHSSTFSDVCPKKCTEKINERMLHSSGFLKKTNFLLITFGTAWVYEHIQKGHVVSNCHKMPAKEFVRFRLTSSEIVNIYKETIWKLKCLFPDLNIIFTVSPIRHWKDGAHENNISKGILLLAVEELTQHFDNVYYFPAYELLMDELRDYRYYASDMLHPSDVAVDYIWNRFSDTFFSEDTRQTKKELEQLSADLSHRHFHPESEASALFTEKLHKRKEQLIKKYPFLEARIRKSESGSQNPE